MKGHHKICRLHPDHYIMQFRMEGMTNCIDYRMILTKQLKKRLKRQKLKSSVYRRQVEAYRNTLGYGTCRKCHEYIGEYPDHLNVKSRR